MSFKSRIRKVEEARRLGVKITIPIIWSGKSEAHWRKRTEMACAKGWSIKLIRLTVTHALTTKEEAEAAVNEHRGAANQWVPITVRDRADPEVVRASWDPGLPEWLQSSIDQRPS